MAGEKRFDAEEIRRLLKSEGNIRRVIDDLYGADATFDARARVITVADVVGGRGESCRIELTGPYAGRFRDFNPGGTKESGDLIEAVMQVRRLTFPEALAHIGGLLGAAPRLQAVETPRKPPPSKTHDDLQPINPETLIRYQSLLEREPKALAYLEGRGLTRKTIERFGLGIAPPYPPNAPAKDQTTGAITAPIIDRRGRFLGRMPKTTVPGFTTNPRDAKGWCHGNPQSTWDGKVGSKTKLFVAEGMKDLWRISQELQGSGLGSEVAVLTSTHGSGIPEEWKDPEFWAPWDEVYLGQDADPAGQTMAQTCRRLAARDVRRVRPPGKEGADWTDFFQGGGTIETFEALLMGAPRLEYRLEEARPNRPLDDDADGEYAIERININGAFKKGQLYYPFRVRRTETVEVFEHLPDGRRLKVPRKTHVLVTQIVRSDGDVLTPREMPAPPGTPDEDKIIALEDGTIITSIPRPEDFATWHTESITAYIAAVSAGQAPHRPLSEIMADLLTHLRTTTWLPFDPDYALMAAYIAMSYVYNVFDAIPMLLMNGEKGSGKSTTAETIADLSYNGHVLGAGSEKAMIRFVDMGRGLLVLDDLEKVGQRRGRQGAAEFNDINQILKVSYNKKTGVKTVVDQNGNNQRLVFYGPKVITNISGLDPVNESRTYTIHCRLMPLDVAVSGRIKGHNRERCDELRQELHAWGMAQAQVARELYEERMATLGDRAKQIAAPLEVIAEMADRPEFTALLRQAIERQGARRAEDITPVDLVIAAVTSAVVRGARYFVSAEQIRLELAQMPEAMMGSPNQPDDLQVLEDTRWIGKVLLAQEIRRTNESRRLRLPGGYNRWYDLHPEFVARVLKDKADAGEPVALAYAGDDPRHALRYCEEELSCGSCPYSGSCRTVQKDIFEHKARSTGPVGGARG
jgi:hypothetical protein